MNRVSSEGTHHYSSFQFIRGLIQFLWYYVRIFRCFAGFHVLQFHFLNFISQNKLARFPSIAQMLNS